MKILICVALLIVCVAAEFCLHDSDCSTTVCAVGFRPDCHHITKSNIDSYICTCKTVDKDLCIDDAWCAIQNADKSCSASRGYAWDCDSGDHGCRCHCNDPHGCKHGHDSHDHDD